MSNEITGVVVLSLMFGVIVMTLFMVQYDIRRWINDRENEDTQS